MSSDPARDGLNWNMYVTGDPVGQWDPDGRFVFCAILVTAAIYTATQAAFAVAETAVEYGINEMVGGGDFSIGSTFLRNFGIDMLTGGIAGKAKVGSKLARLGYYALRQGIEIAGNTIYDMVENGASVGSSLISNTIGALVGEGIGRGLGIAGKHLWRRGVNIAKGVASSSVGRGLRSTIEFARGYTRLGRIFGESVEETQEGLNRVLRNDFSGVNFSVIPEISFNLSEGVVGGAFTGTVFRSAYTKIGNKGFRNINKIRDTILHEELHHRFWSRKWYQDHHKNILLDNRMTRIIERYAKLKGWLKG